MGVQPVLTFHDGKLHVPEQLQHDWKLREGSQLRVTYSRFGKILLEPSEYDGAEWTSAIAEWHLLRGSVPDLRTPEWESQAKERKNRATSTLERLRLSPEASTTELKQAEREWELADDELDFGPFPHE